MKHRATRTLYDYWNRRRGDLRAPGRGDIEPADIQSVLTDTFILQYATPNSAPFRLSGTRMCLLFDRELKGWDFQALWDSDDAETLNAAIRLMREDASCALVHWRGHTDDGRHVSGEMVLLPLTLGGPEILRYLGASGLYELPYWLGSVPVRQLSITAIRMINPANGAARPATIDPAFASGTTRKVGHLTVFEGGRNPE